MIVCRSEDLGCLKMPARAVRGSLFAAVKMPWYEIKTVNKR